ncbi:MAG TPA: LytTR family DNA-binding domain-containing protein [Bacteroidales bacterium]|nr:LytTR family DNA-binding domain-containing protein [Bacteroidales bacterium]HPT02929.1 LytTR family DNA-binding domain-containing protein [Bacteroidales bacterium]
MKKYNAIIIDDEKNIREALTILLKQYCPEIQVCGIACSAGEGRMLLETNMVDFIFLDIAMPKEDGFTFLRSIPSHKYGIIFATAYQEHALRALKANAIDYLLKPINPIELQAAVKKAIYYHELRNGYSEFQEVYQQSLNNLTENLSSRSNPVTKLTIPEQSGFRLVNVDEVMYLQAADNYTVFSLTDKREIISTRTLGEFEKILESPEFFRIHKSTIINLNFLTGYSCVQGNYAELMDGSRLDISRRKLSEFRDRVKNYSFSID